MCLPPEQTQTPTTTTTYRGWWMVGVCEDPHRVGVWWDFGGRCEFGSNPPFFRHAGGLDHPFTVRTDRRQSPASTGDRTGAVRGDLRRHSAPLDQPPRRTNSHPQPGSMGSQRRPKLPPTTQTPTKAQIASNWAIACASRTSNRPHLQCWRARNAASFRPLPTIYPRRSLG
jgi:hypothetical protein